MSDTPRTDAIYKESSHCFQNQEMVFASFARHLERELAAAQAGQRTAAQQVQGLVKPSGDSCGRPTTPVAAAAPQPPALSDEQIDDAERSLLDGDGCDSQVLSLCAQAKRANALAAELAAQKEQYRVRTDEMLVIHTRYETVRRMRPAQFAELFRANIEQNIPFDDLVDNAAIAQGRQRGGE